MRKLVVGSFVLALLFLSVPAFAQNPLVGTWKFVSGHTVFDPTPHITLTLEKNGLHFARKDGGGNAGGHDEWTALPDGKTYPWTSTDKTPSTTRTNQVVLDRREKGIVELTHKVDGKVTGKTRITVSADGKEFILINTPEGGTALSPLYWTRAGGPKDSANPLVGTWRRDDDRGLAVNPQPPLRIESEGENALRWTIAAADTSFKHSKFDGKEYPIDPGTGTIVSKRIDDRTFEISTKNADATTTTTYRWVLSADGREITYTQKVTGTAATATKYSYERKYRKQ